ncbi:1,4-dihydroxy-2-naphthoate octaprenyltransferase [Gilvibacter sp.]|uniref:1,4-dihydroxy-2-naphthoate octaprenyltransferase n=1 Tax=Gilvibacter sp. TaxID=2729997 RepID=UPI0025C04494|nr:1,4-dihydroxy-2-naphthoate octaprenyltransferase [Gilvibacter sp.]NQX78179.1 1,4-dihydroxy-2-naphthoate octaprenyltransferase [Gilvibacter sp.]
MSTTKAWISAARLRTLPLSVAGIIAAAGLALRADLFDPYIFLGSLFTAIGFQVLSNFANDYGDGVKGTDNEDRVGPMRAMQSGALTAAALKKGMLITALITLALAVGLIYRAFGLEQLLYGIVFLVLGIVAIIAAIKYTVGDSPYGYRGLGDVFVFLFFGLVSVVGGYFLYTKQLDVYAFLPAVAIGLWSAAVLNLNNMRDRESDAKVGKNTLAVKLGKSGSLNYHTFLILGGSLAAVLAIYLNWEQFSYWSLLPFVAVVLLNKHLVAVRKTVDHKKLDPQLKVVALSTFLYALLLLISHLVS